MYDPSLSAPRYAPRGGFVDVGWDEAAAALNRTENRGERQRDDGVVLEPDAGRPSWTGAPGGPGSSSRTRSSSTSRSSTTASAVTQHWACLRRSSSRLGIRQRRCPDFQYLDSTELRAGHSGLSRLLKRGAGHALRLHLFELPLHQFEGVSGRVLPEGWACPLRNRRCTRVR